MTDESVQATLPQWHALADETRNVWYRCCVRVEADVEVEFPSKRQRRASARAAFLSGTSLLSRSHLFLLDFTTSRLHGRHTLWTIHHGMQRNSLYGLCW